MTASTSTSATANYYAAVDLGSNSFHLLVAKVVGNRLEVVDRHKEMVQIARGLDERGNLAKEMQAEAIAVLLRINERLRDIAPENIRAVGTKTLRAARNADKFLRKAEEALGHPINIISGFEEARLVYQGVVRSLEDNSQKRLVIDIGGASTEFIIGEGRGPRLLESLNLGCVTLAERHFKFGPVTKSRMEAAYISASAAIEPIARAYKAFGWDIALGTSGTMRAAAELMDAKDQGLITRTNLDNIIQQTILDGEVLNGEVPKLRRDVLPAGLAIIKALFDQLGLEQLHIADVALKEGLIFEIIGREANTDSREDSVNRLAQTYQCDQAQRERVAELAVNFTTQLQLADINDTKATQLVAWAGTLHEIGLHISHNGFHKHGYYLLRHHDMSGFSRYEQHMLAALVRLQRSAIKTSLINELAPHNRNDFMCMVVALRLAVILCRGREALDINPTLALQSNGELTLALPKDWLEKHPLSAINLHNEAEELLLAGVKLNVS
ncbi:exopolyphosphatase [Simiduia litorea]|uniref:Ppx/GppA phosphatase family protein n=1 Tax=Simiduia litorea TaxID=1435348 RepID=UPI0036F31C79